MRIFVKAKVRARKEYVKMMDETHLVVAVKAPPVEGKANEAIIRVLADYFAVARENVIFLSGKQGSRKVFEIKKPQL